MVSETEKIKYSEFFIQRIYEEKGEKNDFSILKTVKLLFFTVSASLENGKSNKLLDEVFSEFYAMPLGPVEIDFYNYLKDNKLTRFKVDKISTKYVCNGDKVIINDEISKTINKGIERLKKHNKNIFNESVFNLVELSHKFDSWKFSFNEAKIHGKLREKIDKKYLVQEHKYFELI